MRLGARTAAPATVTAVCTVVTRWRPGAALELLAVRDELASRDFDEPAAWWPDAPGVVGGRDRQAGGSWCVSEIASGVTALVLNRPERRTGTPSRGVLPLAAIAHGTAWPSVLDYRGMATFTLLLAGPTGVVGWEWDGAGLCRRDLPPGLHVATPRGIDPGDPRALRVTPLVATRPWLDVLSAERPSAAEDALIVRHEVDGDVYRTVFGQLITAEPGSLGVRHSRTPWDAQTWTTQDWTA